MSAYREFSGKSVEEALKAAREEFGVELNDLDFEILTAGSRGVLGMGAEPARIVAAPRAALYNENRAAIRAGGRGPQARGGRQHTAAAASASRAAELRRSRPRSGAGSAPR